MRDAGNRPDLDPKPSALTHSVKQLPGLTAVPCGPVSMRRNACARQQVLGCFVGRLLQQMEGLRQCRRVGLMPPVPSPLRNSPLAAAWTHWSLSGSPHRRSSSSMRGSHRLTRLNTLIVLSRTSTLISLPQTVDRAKNQGAIWWLHSLLPEPLAHRPHNQVCVPVSLVSSGLCFASIPCFGDHL